MTKNNSGLYINTRTSTGSKLYLNAMEVPAVVFFDPEEKEIIKNLNNWKELKDVMLYKIQRGEEIFGNPMTDKELNQFCKIAFKYFKELDKIKD